MLRTIEAVYENGMLRPLEPIEPRNDQTFLVTILNTEAMQRRTRQPLTGLRGKYQGYLSTSDEFARGKASEKALER